MRASSGNSTSLRPALRGGDARTDALRVAGDVADGGVHLAERQAHYCLAVALPAARVRLAALPTARVRLALCRCDCWPRRRLPVAVRQPWPPSAARGGPLRGAPLGAAPAGFRRIGGAGEPAHRALELLRDRVEVGQRVVVAEQAEAEVAVVAHHRDPERLAAGERHDGVERAQAAPEQVERELGARHVGDDEVEVALAGLQARGLAEDRRRGEAGEVGEHLGADRLAGVLEVLHRHADLLEALRGVLDPDRQRRPHRGDAVAERAALGVGAHRDGHHRLQHQPLGG